MTSQPRFALSDELTNVDRDINYVIMDYLINEGFPVAAQKFAKEADILPSIDGQAIQERVDIRNAIHAGNMQLAIEKINELNTQVCCLSFCYHFPFHRKDYIMFHAPLRAFG